VSDPISELEPKIVFDFFSQILAIPRCSGREEAMRSHLVGVSRDRGWEPIIDDVGNLVIKVPGSPGKEASPVIVLQGHLDMVCEKNNDVDFDFETQGIEAVVAGSKMKARGTTLGADNGIGLALALALAADPEVVRGPLEILCTVEEETGLTGASGLEGSNIDGRILVNIDTEEEGALYVGCAGGGDQTAHFRAPRMVADTDTEAVRIQVKGLKGGHSGLDIHLGRGNAIQILAGLIAPLLATELAMSVDTLWGGNLHNAIPREAEAVVRVKPTRRGEMEKLVAAYTREQGSAYIRTDGGLQITTATAQGSPTTIPAVTIRRLLGLLLEIPHGVVKMSPDIEGLVQTSNNLAVVKDDGRSAMEVMTSSRSSVSAELEELRDRICAMYEQVGAEIEREDAYPGWEPDMGSDLLARCKRVYAEKFGREPEIKAVHAGLECGIIGEAVPGMDMISLGPTLGFPHSPDEFLDIPSTGKVWDLLKALMADLAG
jgi:dipeptidase D